MSLQGYNSTAFLAWAKRQGYLLSSKERRTITSRIAGHPTNCVCIVKKSDPLPDDFEEIEDDLDF